MKPLPYPQPILLRLSDVSDVSANTAHHSAYVTTTLPAIVQGLRNMECQPDPYNEFQGPDALFSRLLATIVGTTEYDAVIGNEVERLNALLAEQVENVESLRQDVARLTQERDDARADFEQSSQDLQTVTYHGKLAEQEAATLRRERDEARRFVGEAVMVPGADVIFTEARRRINASTTTPGAQA